MIAQLTVLLLATLAVSANPAANKPWQWVNRNLIVDPLSSPYLGIDGVEDLEVNRATPRVAQDVVVVSDCGKAPLAPPVKGVIVGGTEAPPHSLPWQVALYIDEGYFCGGSIISDEWVMTAAHCIDRARYVDVVAGAHNLSQEEPSQVTMRSTEFFVHRKWIPNLIRNDIAMIRLPQKLTFNDYIQPVCLPYVSESDLEGGEIVTASGWGDTEDMNGGTPVLMEVQNPILANAVCQKLFRKVTDENICTRSVGRKGPCNGDSGGPLNYKTGTVTEIRGIASYGSLAGCESLYPTVFTRVSHYLDWIKKHTGVTRG